MPRDRPDRTATPDELVPRGETPGISSSICREPRQALSAWTWLDKTEVREDEVATGAVEETARRDTLAVRGSLDATLEDRTEDRAEEVETRDLAARVVRAE